MVMIKLSKKKYLKICPKCKSIDVRTDKSTLQQLGAIPAMYICNKCKHSGYNFPELEISELDKPKKKIDKKSLKSTKDRSELIDTSYGRFWVRFIWKIESIILLLIGILLLFNYKISEKIVGIILILMGAFMFYITYFKKRRLREE